MPVKPLRSATRVLTVLEAVAAHQPVGLGALARALDEDKSAVQRALATLADDGWIRPAAGDPVRWELTTRALVMAHLAAECSGLRHRARAALETLRDETGESIVLAIPDAGRIVTLDVVESRQLVRSAPYVGMVIPTIGSAAGQALLAHLPDDELVTFLGAPPDAALRETLATVRARGWSLNHGDVVEQASSIGAAVLDTDGRPVAVIAISAPSERMPPSVHESLGRRLAESVAALSPG